MAYIERETVQKVIKNYGKNAIEDGLKTLDPVDDIIAIENEIELIPAADVVEVVHCKNCKCFEKFQAGHLCNKFGGIVTKEDYCSRGERMANNGNQNP